VILKSTISANGFFLRTIIKQLKENLEHALKQNEELSNQIKNATKLELNSAQSSEREKEEVTHLMYSFLYNFSQRSLNFG
jgi:microcompartment protein CcmL/EutN